MASLGTEKTSLLAELAEQKTSGEATASTTSDLSDTIVSECVLMVRVTDVNRSPFKERLEAERDLLLAEKKSTVEHSASSTEASELKVRYEKEITEAKANEQVSENSPRYGQNLT